MTTRQWHRGVPTLTNLVRRSQPTVTRFTSSNKARSVTESRYLLDDPVSNPNGLLIELLHALCEIRSLGGVAVPIQLNYMFGDLLEFARRRGAQYSVNGEDDNLILILLRLVEHTIAHHLDYVLVLNYQRIASISLIVYYYALHYNPVLARDERYDSLRDDAATALQLFNECGTLSSAATSMLQGRLTDLFRDVSMDRLFHAAGRDAETLRRLLIVAGNDEGAIPLCRDVLVMMREVYEEVLALQEQAAP